MMAANVASVAAASSGSACFSSAAAAGAPRICVLGGGLPGLATAYFLQRKLPRAHIKVIEREAACGLRGGIFSAKGSGGRVFEQGFHSSILVNKQGREVLGLVRLLGLDDDVVSANVEASARRHLLHNGRVGLVPSLAQMLRYGPMLLAEPLWPRSRAEDESVHAFVARRCSVGVADRFVDPLCRGQLAGDARELSVRVCFPRLWFNEQRFRSVFVGSALSTLPAYRRRSWLSLDVLDPLLQRVVAGGRSYSLRAGLGMLSSRLEEKLTAPLAGTRPAEIMTGTSVVMMQPVNQGASDHAVELKLDNGERFPADVVISAIPPHELASLLEPLQPPLDQGHGGQDSIVNSLRSIKHSPVTVVNVAFDADVLRGRFKGAGYFSGSFEKEPVLAVTSDSQLFPEQDPLPNRTRLSVHVDAQACSGSDAAEKIALDSLRRHLGITEDASEVHSKLWSDVAVQYMVGHQSMMRSLDVARRRNLPWLHMVGPGYYGTRSAADEIVDARALADSLGRRLARFPGLIENEVEEDTVSRYGGGFDIAS